MPRLLATLIASVGLACAGLACAGLIAGCGGNGSDEPSAADGSAAGETGGGGKPAGSGGESGGAAADAEQGAAAAEGEPAGQSASAAAKRRRAPRVVLRDSQFGPVLFDGRRRALYLFTRDPRRETRCYGACADAWPPFYAKGRPRAGRGVDASLLGTIERRDGRLQVTYKGQALYFYLHDPRGQVLCNDVVEFGGTWYAVDAAGDPPA